MQIKPGKPTDAGAIEVLNSFDCDIEAAVAEGRCLVAVIEQQIAGFVIYKTKGMIGKNFIEYLVVDEAYRRRGLAIALLRAVEQTLGPCRLFISTEADNTPMRALLDKDHWQPAGQIDGINDSGHAELFFYRDLSD